MTILKCMLISKIVKGLNSNNYIFNKEYYLSNYKKKDAQILLNKIEKM